jgi:glycosyltransferase involved in cell wall biosynthesis
LVPKITALAITYNEEENVERYFESLSFADEIIFVDSQSTDKTIEIAERLGVKVIQRKFDDFSNQRNFAIEQASHDWILFFDLDETTGKEISEKKCYIRIPPEVCRKLKLRVGTPLDIRVRNGCIQVTRQIRNKKKGKTT